jgi:hypothetical protein
MRTVVASIEGEFRRYKQLADGAMGQLSTEELGWRRGPTENAIATIVHHIGGNLKSRFTDFLTSDGEKPWRERDREFVDGPVDRDELAATWESGWTTLFSALAPLGDGQLGDTVTIRGQGMLVIEALHRSLAHIAYHVGQIVFVAKGIRGADWTYLSIPPGKTAEYNRNPTRERAPGPATADLPTGGPRRER